MVSVVSLWLPILLSAVIVFVASSVIHMLLSYHRSDFKQVPSEEKVMDALRPFNIPPGDYVIPRAGSTQEMGSPEFAEKMTRGPVAFVTVLPSGPPSMTGNLILWFLYCVLVGIVAAYVAGRAVAPGGEYLAAFRFAGTAAFLSYAMALLQNSIWYKRDWSATLKSMFDGLIYALLTGGIFGWLWP
jgi:hypothetical protein